MREPFDTPIQDTGAELVGPLRSPHQMLSAQQYDQHSSIHDDATAQKLGFKGGTIEGPTHFSQFAPLCVAACALYPFSLADKLKAITEPSPW